jgi:ribosomal protein S18 acetylase RimI-like enzyme
MIKIIEVSGKSLMFKDTEKLIREVFPEMDLSERLSFLAYKYHKSILGGFFVRLAGVSQLQDLWVAVDENNQVCGTTGLYTHRKDEQEANWLSWFCVAPEYRGQGIAKKLLEFSIELTKEQNKRYLRLYTSDDPGEAAAQELYEKYGFKIVRKQKRSDCTLYYRELEL